VPVRFVAFVIVLVAALAAAAATLASVHGRVRGARAARHFDDGHQAAARGDLNAAVAEYRASLSLDRRNTAAERALALTLQALGELPEAESYFVHLLQEDPTSGPLNRGLARIYAAQGRTAAARASYQRAIYGEWPESSTGRLETRLELVDYLRSVGANDEILPELLRLKTEVPAGATETVRRVADSLIQENAVETGMELMRAASAVAPRDVELLAHLAGVEARAGRTADARATLARAVLIDPRREDLRARLSIVERVLALDPTMPRLRIVARTRRAHDLLTAVLQQTSGCEAGDPLPALRTEAGRRVNRAPGADARIAEQQLGLASRIWQASSECHASTGEAAAIDQVLQRVRGAEDARQ
jgi:tetratricopeptide (TPR) repeat protein